MRLWLVWIDRDLSIYYWKINIFSTCLICFAPSLNGTASCSAQFVGTYICAAAEDIPFYLLGTGILLNVSLFLWQSPQDVEI